MLSLSCHSMDDNELVQRFRNEFSSDEQQHFLNNFQLYLRHGKNSNDFVVKFDNVWKWLGISRKDNAKRILTKDFIKDLEYIIIHNQPSRCGGQNHEDIYMTIETFKAFCMMANTEKGKATRRYYSKMENIFFDYLHTKYNTTIETLQNDNKQLKLKKALELHRKLIDAYKMTPLVYAIVVEEVDDDTFTIKFGYTHDIESRVAAHRLEFKDCMLIDAFPCI